jgi:predicted acylesterase/phospholipase RssA
MTQPPPRPARAAAAVGLVLAVAVAAGCTEYNRPLNSLNLPLESRAANHTRAATYARVRPPQDRSPDRIRPASAPAALDDPAHPPAPPDADGYFIGLAISGGGSRSANFAAACMFQLQRLGLLQRVDYISSVSGGSLPAAYYCTHGYDEWNPGDVQRKLSHPFASDGIAQSLLPWNSAALMFTAYDRTDLLADTFTDVLFSRGGRALTYADLRDDRPRLLVNATDLQSGRRFVFSDESFDEINSDLAAFPIARAVAASSAVPVLLHQLTLKDHSTTIGQFRHLVDGGVSDNTGAQTLVETFAAHIEQARARGAADPYPNGAVFVLLDATVGFDARLSDQEDITLIESLVAGAGLSSTALVNRAGTATLAEIIVQNAADDVPAKALRQAIADLKATGYLSQQDRTGHTVRVVHIALSQVDTLSDVPFMSFRESVNHIATYFNIDRTEAFHLYQAARLLVEQKHEGRLSELRDEIERRAGATPPG